MVENEIKITISIDEPWNSEKVFNGIVIRSLNLEHYWVIKEDGSDQLYMVQCRYAFTKLKDILKGETVIIGIYIPLPEIDLLTIPEITRESFKWLKYSYIGGMELITKA